MPDDPEFQFIPLSEACIVTGHRTKTALDRWLRRFNERNPGKQVLRRPHYVDYKTLLAALKYSMTERLHGPMGFK